MELQGVLLDQTVIGRKVRILEDYPDSGFLKGEIGIILEVEGPDYEYALPLLVGVGERIGWPWIGHMEWYEEESPKEEY
jgi:hypothetical protein